MCQLSLEQTLKEGTQPPASSEKSNWHWDFGILVFFHTQTFLSFPKCLPAHP